MGTETLLRRIYAGQKYPHVYTLSINTGKNQSTEASGALYIPTYEYNYKVITRGDTYYKNITSLTGANARIQGDIQVWTVQMEAQSDNRKTLEPNREAWKDGASDGLPEIYASAAPLWSAIERIHKPQALKPKHEDLGESDRTPRRVVMWMPSGEQR